MWRNPRRLSSTVEFDMCSNSKGTIDSLKKGSYFGSISRENLQGAEFWTGPPEIACWDVINMENKKERQLNFKTVT